MPKININKIDSVEYSQPIERIRKSNKPDKKQRDDKRKKPQRGNTNKSLYLTQ